MGWFDTPRRRKSKKVLARQRGREVYKKGKKYEKDVAYFLKKKGFKKLAGRYRSPHRETDIVMQDRNKNFVLVEAKALSTPVTPAIVTKLQKGIVANPMSKYGVIVSKKGATAEAQKLAKKYKIHIYKYGGRKKKSNSWW